MKKTLIIIGTTISIAAPMVTPISCGVKEENGKWDTNISMNIKTPYDGNFDKDKFEKSLEKEINKIIDKKIIKEKHVNVNIHLIEDDSMIVDNISSHKYDFGISSISSINDNSKHDEIRPILQTKTKKFIWEKNNNTLTKQTELETQSIQKYKNLKNNKFNGSIFPMFYWTNFKDAYRGMILISGTKTEIINIKKAWENKNWKKFLSFGIIHGNPKSGGKFKLQESLLKKHFGNDAFKTLNEEFSDTENKYDTVGKGQDIGDDSKYKIAFDDNGSFGWTSKKGNIGAFTPKVANNKIEVLALTESIKYDVGYTRGNFNIEEGKIISQAFISLAKQGKDIYGPKIGYGNYGLVTQPQKEIYDKYQKVLGVIHDKN